MTSRDQAQGLRNNPALKRSSIQNSKALRCIAVASGKGGVGKTFVSVNLACALSKLGSKVLLIDADLSLANVDILLGATPERTLHDVIFHGFSFSDVVLSTPQGPDFIAAASGEKNIANIGQTRLKSFVDDLLSFASDYDVLLFDCGAGISSAVTSFIAAAPLTVVVMTVEPTSLMDAYALMKISSNENYTDKINLVLNMVESEKQGRTVFKKIAGISKNYLNTEVNLLATIPRSKEVHQAVINRKPLVIDNPDSEVSAKVMKMAADILSLNASDLGKLNTDALMKGIMNLGR